MSEDETVIDLTITTPTTSATPSDDGPDAFTVRLCLDLLLDALLLMLGAAAACPDAVRVRTGTGTVGLERWDRWLTEDLNLTVDLAREVLAGGATLPTALGKNLDCSAPSTLVDQLVSRYTMICELLPAIGNGASPALVACAAQLRQRLRELDGIGVHGTAAVHGVTRYTDRPAPTPTYLPGELLG